MKILCISNWGFFGDTAMRMALEGHSVKLYVHQPEYKDIFDDISCGNKLEKVKDWSKFVAWCDFAILDDTSFVVEGKEAPIQKTLLAAGIPTFGMCNSKSSTVIEGKTVLASEFAKTLEDSRGAVHALFKELEMGVPYEEQTFKTPEEAIVYMEEHPDTLHVIKPELGDAEKSLTFVGELADNRDSIKFLRQLPLMPDVKNIKHIGVEEKKEGIEVAVSAYFNGKKFLQPIYINFEHKKFAAGGKGFNTGEMGTSICAITDPGNPLFKEMNKLAPILAEVDYRGEMDINCIVTPKGDIFILEPTDRVGVPSGWIQSSMLSNNLAELFRAVAMGQDYEQEAAGWATGVVLCTTGYPWQHEATKRAAGTLVDGVMDRGVPTDMFEDVHIAECKLDKDLDLVVCDNNSGYIGCAVGMGDTLEESIRDVYDNVIPNVKSNGIFYREDIGQRVVGQIAELEKMGFKFT